MKLKGSMWSCIGLATLLMAGCDKSPPISTAEEQPSAPKKQVAFQPDWVPKALGSGNFEVCLSNEAEENGVKDLILPVGMMFDSWGHMTGSLRDSKAFDGEGTSGFGKSDQYALALTARVHLTSDRPCAITQAQAVTHQGFRYRHETVPASLHYNFSAGGLYLNKKGGITNDMKGPAGDAAQIGLLSGTPISDVGDVYRATEDL